jgi:enoyl-CoA hydratase/carnithine racemase
MNTTTSPMTITQHSAEYWRVTIDNPPINLLDPDLVAGLSELIDRLEADDHVKVVVFDSADPDYFISHVDLLRVGEEAATGRTGLPAWPDVTTRLERASFVTVGSVRGRARGVGSEFLLALDVRFASLERAIFCQPEVGFGFVPGGGGLERLPLVTGRSRALEIIVGCEDFDAATAERYGWINRAMPDDQLDAFVERFAQRVASFDRDAIALAKRLLNERGQIASPHDLVATYGEFGGLLAEPTTQARAARFLNGGLQQRSEFELNLSSHLQD